jgi:hydroxyethylthiazole kinase-like uncharacterized protein yjeF
MPDMPPLPMPRLPPIYPVAGIRALEAAAQTREPGVSLMERAGSAAAEAALQMLGGSGRHISVLAGPGNNGGDALEVATHLRRQFFDVTVVFIGDRQRLPADAARAFAKWQAAGGALSDQMPRGRCDLLVDGLFGIGLGRPPQGRAADLIAAANAGRAPILALDIPSGLHGDTGAVLGSAIHARRTITFLGLKPGLLTLDGPDHAGDVTVAPLGFAWAELHAPSGFLLDTQVLDYAPPARPRNFHKGNAGTVGIAGGADGMVGAALLAGRAALHAGAGKVLVGMLCASAPSIDIVQPELMLRTAQGALEGADVIAVGPGLGRSEEAKAILLAACAAGKPMVVDADALNLAGADAAAGAALARCRQEKILTPHPAEAARLLGASTAQVQADRVAAAVDIARRFAAHVVLKGNGSIVAAPDGPFAINGSGNAGMASAGMGDALTGIAAALLAQGVPALRAARLAVWLHGTAGDRCAADTGALGITASEVIAAARRVLNGAYTRTSDR